MYVFKHSWPNVCKHQRFSFKRKRRLHKTDLFQGQSKFEKKKSDRLHNFLQVFLRLPLGVTCASEHKNFKNESEEFTASLPFDRVLQFQGVYQGRNESFFHNTKNLKTKFQRSLLSLKAFWKEQLPRRESKS